MGTTSKRCATGRKATLREGRQVFEPAAHLVNPPHGVLSVTNRGSPGTLPRSRRTVHGVSARSSSSASERGGLLVAVNPEGQVVEEPVVQVVDETVKREPRRTLPRPLHDGCS